MPKMPVIQHQNSAPGPPTATAVETPMIFPVPSVAARVVASAAKPEGPEPSSLSGVTDSRMAFSVSFCGNRSRMVKYRWEPARRKRRGSPQRN